VRPTTRGLAQNWRLAQLSWRRGGVGEGGISVNCILMELSVISALAETAQLLLANPAAGIL
jgi:hypothetical protein